MKPTASGPKEPNKARVRYGFLGVLAAALWAAAMAGGAVADDGPEARFFAAANRLRAAHGAPPLMPEARLACAARAHAADMAATGWLSHEGADGATLTARLQRVGYPFARAAENIARVAAANVAQAGAENVIQAGADSRKVLALWMASPGHRRNLLDSRLTEAGLGRARRPGTGDTFWVLVLGTRFGGAAKASNPESACP